MTPPSGPSGPSRPSGGSPGAPRTENSVDPRVEPAIDDVVLDDVGAVPEAPNDSVVDDLDDLLFAARRERDEYLDLSRRVQADFENYKKRMVAPADRQLRTRRRGPRDQGAARPRRLRPGPCPSRCRGRTLRPRARRSWPARRCWPTRSSEKDSSASAWPASLRPDHPRSGGPRRLPAESDRGRRAPCPRARSSTRCCGPGTGGRDG